MHEWVKTQFKKETRKLQMAVKLVCLLGEINGGGCEIYTVLLILWFKIYLYARKWFKSLDFQISSYSMNLYVCLSFLFYFFERLTNTTFSLAS